MANSEKIFLGIMDLIDAKRLEERLAETGVVIELGFNAQTCKKGCRVTVEVWADQADLPKIEEVMKEERSKLLKDLDFDPQQIRSVFDPSKKTAVCPACGTEFSTKLKECPECGLVFQTDDSE